MGTLPPLVVKSAIEPKFRAAHARMLAALQALAAADPAFAVMTDAESGQTVVQGTSEAHLDEVVGRLAPDFGIEVNRGAPQAAYRETIGRTADVDCTHTPQTGSPGSFARVKLYLKPVPSGSGFAYREGSMVGALPKELRLGIEAGVWASLACGVAAGFPVIDVRVALIDAAFHGLESSAAVFEATARKAMREGLVKAGPVLLEPVMRVSVQCPRDCREAVIRHLAGLGGRIAGRESREDGGTIEALAPLARLFGCADVVARLSKQRATVSMAFSSYAPVPRHGDDPPFGPAVGMRA
jgi:elongation factor G